PALAAALDVVGHPIVHLWVSASAPDVDAFVYLEEIDARGNARYITEGNLRASHRALGQAPYQTLGLPFHSFFRRDQTPIPAGEAVELVFDLLPTAWRYSPGKRLRVTVAFADAGNFATPILNPPAAVKVYRDPQHPSYIEIPTVPSP
ncbi:MAG TPA: CocE/NonD family hydrolase, partial [bacterium]